MIISATRIVGTGFPPEEGVKLAKALLADQSTDWDNLVIDVKALPAGLLISAFFNGFLQHIANEHPDFLERARRTAWLTRFPFQRENIALWMEKAEKARTRECHQEDPMITKETLDKLRALLAKATPGKWEPVSEGIYVFPAELPHISDPDAQIADLDLIAAAVNALPELLATLDAQREEIAAHVAQCNMVGAQRDALEAENAALREELRERPAIQKFMEGK